MPVGVIAPPYANIIQYNFFYNFFIFRIYVILWNFCPFTFIFLLSIFFVYVFICIFLIYFQLFQIEKIEKNLCCVFSSFVNTFLTCLNQLENQRLKQKIKYFILKCEGDFLKNRDFW